MIAASKLPQYAPHYLLWPILSKGDYINEENDSVTGCLHDGFNP